MFSVQCSVLCVQCSVFSVKCSVCLVFSVFSVQCVQCSAGLICCLDGDKMYSSLVGDEM